MLDRILQVLMGIGKFMWMVLKSGIGQELEKDNLGEKILQICKDVELEGGTGDEKLAKAFGRCVQLLPGIGINIIRFCIEASVKIINTDTDTDGIIDIFDKCPTVGDQGCGVDANGCPNPCPK